MSRLRSVLLGLAMTAAVAVVFAWQLYRQRTRPDVAEAGGTVLIYEVDAGRVPPEFASDNLASALRRRLDPAGQKGITVRRLGERQVEINVPRQGGHHARQVAEVKQLLVQGGALELRILANSDDDRSVFEWVRNNAAERERLRAAAVSDEPPPSPRPINDKAFDTDLGAFTYSWIELGREERAFYGLADGDEAAAEAGSLEAVLTEARKDRKAVAHAFSDSRYRTNLFYSRVVRRPDRLPEKERDRRYEYFILTRDPERDDGGQPRAVTGEYLETAYPTEDVREGGIAIGFRFNAEGTARLKELTSKNEHREMAIVLDNVIRSAPNVESPITNGTGIITGNFTYEDVDHVVSILNTGTLPALLKPLPVSETTSEPAK